MDIIEYIESKGVEYITEGKNVGSSEVNITCPFCPDGDPSYHLSLNLIKPVFSCWRCKKHGHIFKLVMFLEGGSYKKAKAVTKELSHVSSLDLQRYENVREDRRGRSSVELPSSVRNELLQLHAEWLKSRYFNPTFIFNKYKLMCTGKTTKWKFRLIVPIYQNRRMVGFTSRDVTDKAESPYRHAPNDQVIVPVKHCLYNIDRVKGGTIIVTEGVTDVWRLGDGAVAILGVQHTSQQVKLLSRFVRIFIMFDADAKEQAAHLGYDLSSVVSDVELIELDEGDPADLTQEEVNALRRDLFGKIS